MKTYINVATIAFTFLSLLFAACGKTKATTAKCSEDVICTMMFAMVTTTVMDNTGENIVLDEVYTLRDDTGEKIKYTQDSKGATYTVLDDSYVKKLQNTEAKFHFVGMKGGQQVVNEPYTLSADCCHVNKVAGKGEIIVP